MYNPLGFSVSLTQWRKSGSLPAAIMAAGGTPVFISLHIQEEFDHAYAKDMMKLCSILNQAGAKILADVSEVTLEVFGAADFAALKDMLGLWALRIDDGLSLEEICALASQMPIVLNASTTSYEDAKRIAQSGSEVFAMHNFYPRPETGLDEEFFMECNSMLQRAGLKIMAFIPADEVKRAPLFEGLPTLEKHRHMEPYVAFVDLCENYHVDYIFAADPVLSDRQQKKICDYAATGIIEISAKLTDHQSLYDQVFTCRIDSPKWMIRFQESRAYASAGDKHIAKQNNIARERGTITIDNEDYLRYQGEVQLLRQDFAADNRVNVIGNVLDSSLELIDYVKRGRKFKLVIE